MKSSAPKSKISDNISFSLKAVRPTIGRVLNR
jgi:hypothetical protein